MIEASSGSTAVSEAYFARMLGLRFIAVVPATTAAPKLDAIRFQGGEIHMVDDPRTVYDVAHRLAAETGGHYLDQFTYAERATDWRGNNNIAESIFAQMAQEEHPVPDWIVLRRRAPAAPRPRSAGICATSVMPPGCASPIRCIRCSTAITTIARRPCCPKAAPAAIEGIGRPRVEPSFIPGVIDRMIAVEDADSIGAMRALSDRLGRRVGGSTGTNLCRLCRA